MHCEFQNSSLMAAHIILIRIFKFKWKLLFFWCKIRVFFNSLYHFNYTTMSLGIFFEKLIIIVSDGSKVRSIYAFLTHVPSISYDCQPPQLVSHEIYTQQSQNKKKAVWNFLHFFNTIFTIESPFILYPIFTLKTRWDTQQMSIYCGIHVFTKCHSHSGIS